MSDDQRKVYGGKSASERQAQRRHTLIDAALELLAGEGVEAVTVRRVSAQAGLNARYIYESFEGIDDLLDKVVQGAEEKVTARVTTLLAETAPASGDRATLVRAAITALVEVLGDDPRLLGILRSAGDTTLARRRDDAYRKSVAAVEQILVLGPAATGNRPLQDGYRQTAAHMLVAGWAEVLWAWASGALPLDREQLIEHLTTLLLGVLDQAGHAQKD